MDGGDTAFRDDPDAGAMAITIHACCGRGRPELVGPLAATQDGAEFTVTSPLSGRLYRVTMTYDGQPARPSDEDRIRDTMAQCHPSRVMITCTRHGVTGCWCLTAPATMAPATRPPGGYPAGTISR